MLAVESPYVYRNNPATGLTLHPRPTPQDPPPGERVSCYKLSVYEERDDAIAECGVIAERCMLYNDGGIDVRDGVVCCIAIDPQNENCNLEKEEREYERDKIVVDDACLGTPIAKEGGAPIGAKDGAFRTTPPKSATCQQRGDTYMSDSENLGFLVERRLGFLSSEATPPPARATSLNAPAAGEVSSQTESGSLQPPPRLSRRNNFNQAGGTAKGGAAHFSPTTVRRASEHVDLKASTYIVVVRIPDSLPPDAGSDVNLPVGTLLSKVEVPSDKSPTITCCKFGPLNTITIGYGVRPLVQNPDHPGHTVFSVFTITPPHIKHLTTVRSSEDDVNIGMGNILGWFYGKLFVLFLPSFLPSFLPLLPPFTH